MERKFEIVMQEGSMTDLAVLQNILSNAGYKTDIGKHSEEHTMGMDVNTLTIFIPVLAASITGITSILKAWIKNRTIEMSIKDGNREIHVKQSGSTNITQESWEKIHSFLGETSDEMRR